MGPCWLSDKRTAQDWHQGGGGGLCQVCVPAHGPECHGDEGAGLPLQVSGGVLRRCTDHSPQLCPGLWKWDHISRWLHACGARWTEVQPLITTILSQYQILFLRFYACVSCNTNTHKELKWAIVLWSAWLISTCFPAPNCLFVRFSTTVGGFLTVWLVSWHLYVLSPNLAPWLPLWLLLLCQTFGQRVYWLCLTHIQFETLKLTMYSSAQAKKYVKSLPRYNRTGWLGLKNQVTYQFWVWPHRVTQGQGTNLWCSYFLPSSIAGHINRFWLLATCSGTGSEWQ